MEYINKYVWFQEGPGVRKSQYTEDGVKLLNVANLVEGKIDLSTSKRYISESEAYGKYKHFLVDEGDLIIASSGIQVNYFDKKMGFIMKEHLPLCMNTSTIRFKTLDKNILDIKYFMYFMKSEQFKSQLRKLITGSAQLNFGPSHLEKVKIDIPEISIQKKCINKLDKIKSIIDGKQQQLKDLDELIKSQFVEMFGDIEDKSMGWNRKTWNDVVIIQNGRDYKKIKIEEGGYPVYGTGGEMARANDFLCPENTIIVGRKGSINNPILVKEKFWNVDTAFGIIPGKELHYQYFYYFCLNFNFMKLNKATTLPSTTKIDLLKIEINIPPLELQNKFANLVEQIDKYKFEIQQSLNKMQELYESLMNQYFG